MSVATEISRLQTLKSGIRTKLIALGIIASSTASLSDCTTAITGIANEGAVSQTLDTVTTSYTVPSGYHNGSGTVHISTETKTATPSASSQDITPSSGKVLSKVTVSAIPENLADVSGVTITASEALANKIFVNSSGVQTAGTMVNNGAVAATIDGINTASYSVPVGFHNGSGTVSLTSDIETTLAAL